MKKIISVILCMTAVLFSLCSCGKENNQKNDGKLNIVATIFPPYDFTREIGGDKVNVSMLLKPGMESHSYDPTPQDIIKIQECDLFIYTGGESDEWVKDIMESNSSKPKKILAMMDIVDTVQEEIVDGMEKDNDNGDEFEYDEHVWTSPVNASLITRKISETLCELDNQNADFFKNNTSQYTQKLSALDNEFRKVADNAKRKTIVFGDRFPFRYLADEYGLKYYAAFPGCSSETEPSASTISFLINKVKEENIPVVFSIEFSSGKVADTICESTGAKKLTFHSCHNVTQQELDNKATYYSIMHDNANALKEALN